MHLAEDLVLKQALVKFCTQLELASAFMHKVDNIHVVLCVLQRHCLCLQLLLLILLTIMPLSKVRMHGHLLVLWSCA